MSADISETMARDSFIDILWMAGERCKVHQAQPKTPNDALSVAAEQETFCAADKQRGRAARSVQTSATQKPPEADLQQEVTELIKKMAERNYKFNNTTLEL